MRCGEGPFPMGLCFSGGMRDGMSILGDGVSATSMGEGAEGRGSPEEGGGELRGGHLGSNPHSTNLGLYIFLSLNLPLFTLKR